MQDLSALDREDSVVILREFSKIAIRRVIQLEREIVQLRKAKEEARQQKLAIDDTLTILRKHFFGFGQEKAPNRDPSRPRDEGQLLLHAQSFAPAPKEEETKDLPIDAIEYEMTDELLQDEADVRGYTDATMKDWEEIKGMCDETKEITVIERTYKVIRHRRKKYRYIPSKGADKEVIVTAPGPEKLLPGCSYSIDFALSVVGDKYCYHIPLERQTRKMASLGLKGVGTKTLWNLCQATAVHMEPVAKEIRKGILSVPVAVHCDETPWHIYGNGKDDDGFMWAISNQAGAYYQFEPTRSGKIAEEMLKGYTGPVLSDGYSGYNRLKKISGMTVANCWAHARRKFFDIRENYPKECDEIIKMMDDLFAIERKARDWDDLKRLRNDKSRPLIDRIREWLIEKRSDYLPESGFVKAIDYSLNYWDGLTAFLKDIRIPLSNNDAERAIRHSVMGRKNFYGSQTINGADVTATLYTVIESCKRVDLDPMKYMRYVIGCHHKEEKALTPLAYARFIRSA